MALELLVEKIRADAAREVQAILADSDKECAGIASETRSRGDTLYAREMEALRARMAAAARQETSQREIESRRSLLQQREALLDDLRHRLEEWLASLPDDRQAALLRRLLDCARAIVPAGAFIASAHTHATVAPLGAGMEFVPDDGIGHGFKLRSEDGRIVVDMTFAALARDFWERRRPEFAQELFGEALRLESGDT